MQLAEQSTPGMLERGARFAVPVLLLLSMVTLAFGIGYVVNDITSDEQVVVQSGGSGTPSTDPGEGASSDGVGAAILNEIYSILSSSYVDKNLITEQRFRDAAIQGVMDSLNDPHTDYLSPADIQSGVLDLSSTYQGIGASVSDQTGQVTIIAPFRGSPAEEAGIQSGDIILAVDGESTEGWSDDQAVQVIRGPAGSPVTLTVQHPDGTIEDITITRGDILIESVFTVPALESIPGESGDNLVDRTGAAVEDIAYVHITQFHDRTLGELRAALDGVEDGQYTGLIVDVRSNPGGLLSATVDVVDEFMNDGVILSEVDSDRNTESWSARPGGVAANIPIVVLQDQGSASGAEVLAAALRDNGRATVVGTRSFGKGTVNQLRQLQNCGDPAGCGAVYVSIGRWLTPSGEQIEGVGVTPDVVVEMSQDDYIEIGDVQLFAAIDILRGN
jgi:carboxyl-terminal processing protease